MNPEHPAAAPLPPLEEKLAEPSQPVNQGVTGDVVRAHFKIALIYFGAIFILSLASSLLGSLFNLSDMSGTILFLYWAAIMLHATAIFVLLIKSLVTRNWRALGGHALAIVAVGSLATASCFANVAALDLNL